MKKHLKSQYGFSNFRDFQKEIIKDILNKKDSIVIFPTGGGKSLCYQFPATYLNKKSIVISPLISLMTDQQLRLTEQGIKCVCLNGENKKSNISLLRKRKVKISKELFDANVIYSTPEFFTSNIELFQEFNDICMFAIDEAHCLSEWGHDFRPSYSKLNIIKKTFPSIPIVALTATATPSVLDDIFNSLGLTDVNQYQLGTYRENLSIHVREKSDDIYTDLDIQEGESTIIYTQTRKNTENIYNILVKRGVKAGYYHAGLSSEQKHETHSKFIKDKIKVIVATICFGMGIDKPDIRKVINYGSPCNLETYYQEIGRAGRDGMPSTVVLYYGDDDYRTNSFLISNSDGKCNKRELLNTFQKYINDSKNCRQLLIEHYFDNGNLSGTISKDGKCNNCDNCTGKDPTGVSISMPVTNVLKEARLMVGVVRSLPVNYGVTKIINILRGSDKKFSTNRYYRSGSCKTNKWWKSLINVMVAEDYLEKNVFSLYTVIGLGIVELPDDSLNLYIPGSSSSSSVSKISRKYKYIRDKIAKFKNVSPYMIINDKVLASISEYKPTTPEELINIDGVSTDFVQKYGDIFISISTKKGSTKKGSTKVVSYEMFKNGDSVESISKMRGLKSMTVESHISDMLSENPSEIDCKRLGITDDMVASVSRVVESVGKSRLRPIKDMLGADFSYFQIKICLILLD